MLIIMCEKKLETGFLEIEFQTRPSNYFFTKKNLRGSKHGLSFFFGRRYKFTPKDLFGY
jgi:hypothetical protein